MNKTPQYKIDTDKTRKQFLKEKENELQKANINENFKKWLLTYNRENNCSFQFLEDNVHNLFHSCLEKLQIAFQAGIDFEKKNH